MASRPSAVAFDVVETLMPLEPLAARFERAGLPASALREWFTRLLLYGVGLSVAGDYVPPEAYAAYLKNVSSGNMAALKKAVTSDRAKQMDDPDFKKMFPLIQAMQPKKIVITGGAIDGDSATLTATGDQDGTPATGSIDMKREGGVWKLEHESWKSKSSR